MSLLALFAADNAADWFSLAVKGGELGLLAYLVLRTGPQLLADQRAEREAMLHRYELTIHHLQVSFESRNAAIVQALEKQTALLLEAIRSLAAEVKGFRGPPHS